MLHVGWEAAGVACRTETSPSQAATSEGLSYPTLAEALANPWPGQLTHVGESQPLPAALVCKLGWEVGPAGLVGWPPLAAVHVVGEERDGSAAGSCLGTAAWS